MSVVTKREGINSGRPIIRGTKLTVPHVATLAHDHDISPDALPAEIVDTAQPNSE